MKAWPILMAVCTTTFLTIPALSAPVNGNFESGGFEGWSLAVSHGRSASQPRNSPAGHASISSWWHQSVGGNFSAFPLNGNRFATLETLPSGNFTGNRTFNISLSQQLFLNEGDTVSGWSSFFNGDYEGQDSAWVRVLDCDGARLATAWLEHSGSQPGRDFNSTPYQSATLWTEWSWQAPESGAYTLSLGMTTSGDNNYASYGFFDHIFVVPTNVPEPSTTTLVALGMAGMAGLRRKRKLMIRNQS